MNKQIIKALININYIFSKHVHVPHVQFRKFSLVSRNDHNCSFKPSTYLPFLNLIFFKM